MMQGRRILLFPVLVLLGAFLLDKIFFIGNLEDYFLTTASFKNYNHKVEMLDELEEYLQRSDRKKVLALFGNSRTMPFSNQYIAERYPNWILFNFSVPGGTSDYYLYLLEQFEKRGLKPDHVFLAITPQGMNRTAAVSLDEVMITGLPPGFVARHASSYSLDDLSNYVAKKTFLVYQYRPKLWVIRDRMKEGHLDQFRGFLGLLEDALRKERGSVPVKAEEGVVESEEKMEVYARSIWKDFFVPFHLSEDQVYFTRHGLEILHDLNVPTDLLWVRVSENLRRRIDTEKVAFRDGERSRHTVREVWEPAMRQLAGQFNARFLDMNFSTEFPCDQFSDASHLSAACFDEFTDYLMNEIENRRIGEGM
ncbi:MAG: DUF1574 domain-containing protein [Leptospiraceae bacterium]|nr:DUF1574 domain-containing protein [Leptospiraceae bacterium]